MGLSGPIPIADFEHKRRGEKRPSRQRGTIEHAVIAPSRPEWLEGPAESIWKRVVADLVAADVPLDKVDQGILARYCTVYVVWQKVADKLLEAEPMIKDYSNGGYKKHPAFQLHRDLGDQLLRMESELFLTPKSRQRLTKPKVEDADDSGLLD